MTATTVIVTGGGGFLGQCIASKMIQTKTLQYNDNEAVPIAKLILADVHFPETFLTPALQETNTSTTTAPVVIKKRGSIADPEFCSSLFDKAAIQTPYVSLFHLGAVMSGDGERDFDLALQVNLMGTMHLLQAARLSGKCPKVVFCSAGATIGSGSATDYIQQDDSISDSCRATPHTTYGMTKACCELLLSDYTRRNFIDGRATRLPTICVRAGSANAATTSCFSSIVRQSLAGTNVLLPIARHVRHAVTSTRAAVQAMMTLHNVPKTILDSQLGFDRTVFLPAVALSLGDLEDALYKVVANPEQLGKISYEVDEPLSRVVGSFPTKVDAHRALALGLPQAPSAEQLVREYIEDFPLAVEAGLEIRPQETTTTTTTLSTTIVQVEKVAVVTGGGSGIGRAVAVRLAQCGWTLVLAGRRAASLEETAKMINETGDSSVECTCIPTDVTRVTDVQHLFQVVEQKYGKLHLLFNNAGVNCPGASVHEVPVKDFERVIQTNVVGMFSCAKYAMELMAKGGGGRIINNGSISAHVPRPGSAPYTCSKHAVAGLTKSIALDGRAVNVACGQIDFGNVVSELSAATNQAGRGALQPNGSYLEEPSMDMNDAVETFMAMVNLPLEANVLQMTVMATAMPFVGRG